MQAHYGSVIRHIQLRHYVFLVNWPLHHYEVSPTPYSNLIEVITDSVSLKVFFFYGLILLL